MSFVTMQPKALVAAAGNLQGIGAAIRAANRAAATQFPAQVQIYQAVSAQAAAIHEMFVNTQGTSAGSYAATEAANAVATGWVAGAAGMDFGALPPEIDPGLKYAGPGSGRMLPTWLPQC